MTRADREKCYNEIANKAEQATNTGNSRSVYGAITQLCGNYIKGTSLLKAYDGSDLTSSGQQQDRW